MITRNDHGEVPGARSPNQHPKSVDMEDEVTTPDTSYRSPNISFPSPSYARYHSPHPSPQALHAANEPSYGGPHSSYPIQSSSYPSPPHKLQAISMTSVGISRGPQEYSNFDCYLQESPPIRHNPHGRARDPEVQ
jgi:hypothetical protein